MKEAELKEVIEQLKKLNANDYPELGISLFEQNDRLTIEGNKPGLISLAIALLESAEAKNHVVISDEDVGLRETGVQLIDIVSRDYEPLPAAEDQNSWRNTLGCWVALAVLAFIVGTFFVGLADLLSWIPKSK